MKFRSRAVITITTTTSHEDAQGHLPHQGTPLVINHYYQAGAQVFQDFGSPARHSEHGHHAHEPTHHSHEHDHDHDHPHDHDHSSHEKAAAPAAQDGAVDFGDNPAGVTVAGIPAHRLIHLEKNILEKNDSLARANRKAFDAGRVLAINLISSPGSGKTTLLVRTIEELRKRDRSAAALIGDQQTSRDADRIRKTGADALQINTGKGCHLDAHMVSHAAGNLDLGEDSILFIENVGNLVCPTGFDLGEHRRVVMLSVTEGDDKPLKYPDAILSSQLLVINKLDLLEHVDFDLEACQQHARQKNPGIRIIQLSARSGEGFDEWLDWLEKAALEEGARMAVA